VYITRYFIACILFNLEPWNIICKNSGIRIVSNEIKKIKIFFIEKQTTIRNNIKTRRWLYV